MTDDELYGLAFKRLHEISESLKDEGLDAPEAWAIMFNAHQDLQAGDFGMGSTLHREVLEAQCDALRDSLASLDP